jgi:heme a synthase
VNYPTPRPVPRWLHLGAILSVALAIFPLVLGQIVTSIRAGMADDRWPTEPWYLLRNYRFDFGYLVEHSHRIAGFCVGGVISMLALGLWWTEPVRSARWTGMVLLVMLLLGFGEFHRAVIPKPEQSSSSSDPAASAKLVVPVVPVVVMGLVLAGLAAVAIRGIAASRRGAALRLLGVAALVAVMIQGLLGGLRVKLDALVGPEMALIHGIFAQIVFILLVALAVFTARLPSSCACSISARWSLILALGMFGQVVLGAFVRHTLAPTAQRFHFLAAFVVFGLALWVVLVVWHDRESRERVRGLAVALGILLSFQVVLGVEAWMAKFGAATLPELVPITGWNAAVRTGHALIGTLALAATVALALRLQQPAWAVVDTSIHANGDWRQPVITVSRVSAAVVMTRGDAP